MLGVGCNQSVTYFHYRVGWSDQPGNFIIIKNIEHRNFLFNYKLIRENSFRSCSTKHHFLYTQLYMKGTISVTFKSRFSIKKWSLWIGWVTRGYIRLTLQKSQESSYTFIGRKLLSALLHY